MHSLLKGKTNNRKTYCLATMILLTTMASCEASIQPPQIFRHVHFPTSTHPIQALHNQSHILAIAVVSLLRNPIGFHTTHIPDDRRRERDEPNPACSCRADQWKSQAISKTCNGMNPVIIRLPYNNQFTIDGSYLAYMETTTTTPRNI